MSAERPRFVLTKITPGDYLLPGNDGRSLWRIKQADEIEPVESGGHTTMRTVRVWEAWRYLDHIDRDRDLPDDFLEWSHWSLEEGWCETRREAIAAAMKMSPAS